jgi:hypothetical protein
MLRAGGICWIYGSPQIADGVFIHVDVVAVPGPFSPHQKKDVT